MNISEAILETIKEFNKSPYDINKGDCEEFAMRVIEKLGGYNDSLNEMGTNNLPEEIGDRLPCHVWIEYNGKCYDAECPEGVPYFMMLPIFKCRGWCRYRRKK